MHPKCSELQTVQAMIRPGAGDGFGLCWGIAGFDELSGPGAAQVLSEFAVG